MCEYKSKCSNNNIELFSQNDLRCIPRIKRSIEYDFIFTVNTEFTGESNNNQFKLPLVDGGIYNCIIYWGDGTSTPIKATSKDYIEYIHTYDEPRVYTITIRGQFEGFCFNNGGDCTKIIDISQWGTHFKLGTDQGAYFSGCENLNISATNSPNLQGNTNMSYCFESCSNLDSENLSTWDVSNVSNMEGMFFDCVNFNTNINNWDVSNVTNMEVMFYRCQEFIQPLNNWHVGSVNNMQAMFSGCTKFNSNINDWNVGIVNNMIYMFYGCEEFNQPLNNWNVENVETMSGMFFNCTSFNNPLNLWDVRKVQSMSSMFYNCPSFKQDISAWNPELCTDFTLMFVLSNMNPIISGTIQNTTNYDNLLNSWSGKNLLFNRTFDAGDAKYSITGQPGYITLTTPPKSWTINDGGLQPP